MIVVKEFLTVIIGIYLLVAYVAIKIIEKR